nr:signal peptidase I [Parenemella sanctibonifatiensis]
MSPEQGTRTVMEKKVTSDEEAAQQRTLGHRIWSGIRELGLILLGALIISVVLRTFIGEMFLIPSGSMEQTLQIDDRVVVQKMVDFQRGDIVVFEDHNSWLSIEPEDRGPFVSALEFIGVLPNASQNHLIKRVIGLPGDRVECCDAEGRLMVNGVPIDESAYLYVNNQGEMVEPSEMRFAVVVPQDRIFVMGDHRNASSDSRCHLNDLVPGREDGDSAFIPVEAVVGSAVAIALPFENMRTFSVPEAFAAVPDPLEPAPDKPVIESADSTC